MSKEQRDELQKQIDYWTLVYMKSSDRYTNPTYKL